MKIQTMIRKIICPTDLSAAAQNAVEYAAKLCQVTGATLELLHVEPVYAHDMAFSGRKIAGDVAMISGELDEVCYEVNKMFNVSCSYDIEASELALDEAVSRRADEETLVVVGTNGADNLFQRIFGSNAFNIAKQASSHVLVVPEGVSYGTIQNIAFAWDYEITKPFLRQVKQFADQLGSKLVFLHVSTHAGMISKDIFEALADKVSEVIGEKADVEYERMLAPDVREGLDRYMKKKNAGVLAIAMKSGKMVRKAFRDPGGVGSLPAYPLLIFHAKKHPGPFY